MAKTKPKKTRKGTKAVAKKDKKDTKPVKPIKSYTMAEFAKFIGIDEDEMFRMPFPRFCEFLKGHGYQITGAGIIKIEDVKRSHKN